MSGCPSLGVIKGGLEKLVVAQLSVMSAEHDICIKYWIVKHIGRFGPITLAFCPNTEILTNMRRVQYTFEAHIDGQVTAMFFLTTHNSPIYTNLNIREQYNALCCGSINNIQSRYMKRRSNLPNESFVQASPLRKPYNTRKFIF